MPAEVVAESASRRLAAQAACDMADRAVFPAIPAKNWWDLRQRFKTSPPREVNAAYLSDVLGIQERAAQNIVPNLRQIGLIDDKGKPTERAGRWRDDEAYAEVTREMIDEVYPQALLDVAPPDAPEAAAVKRWFLRETGTGEARANILSAFYRLLAAGDPAGREDASRRADRQTAVTPRTQTRQAVTRKPKTDGDGAETQDGAGTSTKAPLPSLSVAVQVYIDKEMSAEQVDHVFASMAKHLYGKQ